MNRGTKVVQLYFARARAHAGVIIRCTYNLCWGACKLRKRRQPLTSIQRGSCWQSPELASLPQAPHRQRCLLLRRLHEQLFLPDTSPFERLQQQPFCQQPFWWRRLLQPWELGSSCPPGGKLICGGGGCHSPNC